jgi:transcriptional regulator with XRE-family HTH domain
VAPGKHQLQDQEPTSASAQLGELVKLLRLQAGATQTDLAELMTGRGFSWHQSTVNRVETGLRPITWDEAVALASLLRINLAAAANTRDQLYARGVEIHDEQRALAEELVSVEERIREIDQRPERIDMYEYMHRKQIELIAKQNPAPAPKAKKPAAKKRQRKAG